MRSTLRPFALLALLLALMVAPYLYLSRAFDNLPGLTAVRNYLYPLDPEFRHLLPTFRELQAFEGTLPLPIVYEHYSALEKGDYAYRQIDYTIRLAPRALGLPKSQVVVLNPFGPEPFPLSCSVLYQNRLVTLFAPGSFACYQINTLRRDRKLERQLNTRRFRYHWLINNQLVGLAGKSFFVFSAAGRWEPYPEPLPLSRQPKLFEDEQYLAWMTCNGEWGGEVYFYDKQRHLYYLARATCPNTIVKAKGSYFILSSLGHMVGSCDWQQIDDPTQLTRWQGRTRPQDRDFSYDRENAIRSGKQLFDYQRLEMLSTFVLEQQRLFMVAFQGKTFLATWQNDVLTIVDPLFDDGLYAHNPVTTTYGPQQVLINLYSGDDTESSCLLLANRELIKINWSPATVSEPTHLGPEPSELFYSDTTVSGLDSVEVVSRP